MLCCTLSLNVQEKNYGIFIVNFLPSFALCFLVTSICLLCVNRYFSGGATNNNLMSWSRAMELMFELVCLNLWTKNVYYGCELMWICELMYFWTYVNLWTYVFGLVWICDMNIYPCVWNLYCMWYYVLHVILCLSNFSFL
jgi:hypothetical protein